MNPMPVTVSTIPGSRRPSPDPLSESSRMRENAIAAGIGIDEGHAEEKECGGSRSQNQILNSGFERLFAVLQVRNHGVQGDAQNLESEKERNKVTARHQDRATQSRKQEQEIQLLAMDVTMFEVLDRRALPQPPRTR